MKLYDALLKAIGEHRFVLIPEREIVTEGELAEVLRGANEHASKKNRKRKVIICDAYVQDMEKRGVKRRFGYISGNITVIDHHSPERRFAKPVSATNLVIEYVKKHGPARSDTVVVTNHTDADSLLSVLILLGILPADEDSFGRAAVAADHTGEPDAIADLLQAFKLERNLELSVKNLQYFLAGEPLEKRAQELLDERYAERRRAERIVGSGMFRNAGAVSYTVLPRSIDLALVSPLMPDAVIILTLTPRRTQPELSTVRVRIGMKWQGVILLNELEIQEIDAGFGCRFNTGSDRRAGGGTVLEAEKFAELLDAKVRKYVMKNEICMTNKSWSFLFACV